MPKTPRPTLFLTHVRGRILSSNKSKVGRGKQYAERKPNIYTTCNDSERRRERTEDENVAIA